MRKKDLTKPKCADCDNAYDFHSIGANGQPILCKCPYFDCALLLRSDGCRKHYKQKNK